MSATVTRIDKNRRVPFAKIGAGVVEQPALPFFETREFIAGQVHGLVKKAAFTSSDKNHAAEVKVLHSLLTTLTKAQCRDLLFELLTQTLAEDDDYCAVSIARAVDLHVALRDGAE
jgi:hypothetical protein